MDESLRAETRLLRNVSPPDALPGAIVASKSRSNPDYYYHWVRDSGIAVRALLSLYQTAGTLALRQRALVPLVQFVDFSRHIQRTAIHQGIGLGEPKFTVDGAPYAGLWARPQNDGPAIRAIELTRLALTLLDEGEVALVRDRLYDGKLPTDSVIKADLEYVAHHGRETCFDVWEEVRGHHFFTQHLERRALLEGAALARKLGDTGAASFYREQARLLEPGLRRYWQPGQAYITATLDADPAPSPLRSGLDSAVIIATLGGYCMDDGLHEEHLYPVNHEGVLQTTLALERLFADTYPINARSRLIPGVAIGRYPEDRYDGYRTDSLGNPWPSITIAFAMFYYKLAGRYRMLGSIAVTAGNLDFLQHLTGREGNSPVPGEDLAAGEPAFEEILTALRARGDTFLLRVRHHLGAEGSMAEQMNRFTGFQQGAADLTMGYAAFLLAVEARRTVRSMEPSPGR